MIVILNDYDKRFSELSGETLLDFNVDTKIINRARIVVYKDNNKFKILKSVYDPTTTNDLLGFCKCP